MALRLTSGVGTVLGKLIVISFLFQGAEWGNAVLDHWIGRSGKLKGEEDKAGLTMFMALGFVGRLVFWSLALLLALDNLGVNVTALIAGLGVGGIAVALAVQNVLGDLFASISIVLDKPFVIGDFITVGVTYQTPADKLAVVPDMVRRIIESRENVRFDRAHFQGFGAFSLVFEIVYYVTTPDYTAYMDVQQAINMDLYRRFGAEGIEFAYPTQTVLFGREGVPNRPETPG